MIHFLAGATAILGASVVVSLLSHRLRIPPLVGLLATGVLLGPSGLGIVGHGEEVETWAEVGVVLLLFAIGLELSWERLQEMRRAFALGGSLQALGTVALAAGLALAFGQGGSRSLFIGFVLALSSTAIVLSLYGARRELTTPHGRVMLAILLLQDFLIVPMIVVTPVLAGTADGGLGAFALRFGAACAAVAVLFLIARKVMPAVLHAVARVRARELFVLGSLTICLGMALLTESLGFSLALGAFLAGITVSESTYAHQILAEMTPFRDLFASVFFVSIGMLVDVQAALEHWPWVLALTAAIILGKGTVAALAAAALRLPARVTIIVGLGLAQIGEFSFVLLEVGRSAGLIETATFQLLLAAALLTMIATPALVAAAPRVGELWASAIGSQRLADPGPDAARKDHVVIVGFGTNGSLLARVLDEAGIPYVVIELNGETVRREAAAGRPILYGDSTRPEILDSADLATAAMVVFAISDYEAVRRSVRLAREIAPTVEILVRTRMVSEIESLKTAGADHVVAEEFETAIEIFTRVLERFHVPRNVIRAHTRLLRGEDYRMLRAPMASDEAGALAVDLLGAGTTELFRIVDGSPAIGETLASLDLRRRSGASVLALVRGERSWTSPPADLALENGDVLVLVGAHAEIQRATEQLGENAT